MVMKPAPGADPFAPLRRLWRFLWKPWVTADEWTERQFWGLIHDHDWLQYDPPRNDQ